MVDITDTITDAFAEKYGFEEYAKGINAFVKAQVQFLTELSVSQITVALQHSNPDGFTQKYIEAYSISNLIKIAEHEKNDMLKIAKQFQESNPTKAATYQYLANVWNGVLENNQKTLNSFTDVDKIFKTLDNTQLVFNVSKMTSEFIDKYHDESLLSAIGENFFEPAAKLLNDVYFGNLFSEFLVPKMNKIILDWGLNPKSLVMHAAKGGLITLALTVEYELLKWVFTKLFESELIHLYDREWFIEASDMIFDSLKDAYENIYDNETLISWSDKVFGAFDNVKVGSAEFNAVSSIYSLLQANARNTLNEADWKQLFGADEVRKMDMDKVKNVLKESIKIITGKEITVDTTEQMVKAVQENYKAFKDVRGFDLLLIVSIKT